MQFAQIVVTDDQALKTRLAIDLILQDPERFVMTDEERADYERLAVFFTVVANEPSRFPPTGSAARSVKSMVRRAKGAAQPQSRRKPKRTQGQQKRDRVARREYVAQYNAAVEQYEKEAAEAAEYEQELVEKFANEPRVQILRADGVVIMSDIPASMVVPMEPEESTESGIILPPGVIVDPFVSDRAMTTEEVAAENTRIERETAEYFHGDET